MTALLEAFLEAAVYRAQRLRELRVMEYAEHRRNQRLRRRILLVR